MIARLRKLPRLRSGAALIGGLILAMAPPPAAAHLMQTGFSGFYDGLTPLVAGAVGLRQSGEPSLDLLTTLSFALVGLLVALRLQLGVAGSWIAAAGLLRLGWLARRAHEHA